MIDGWNSIFTYLTHRSLYFLVISKRFHLDSLNEYIHGNHRGNLHKLDIIYHLQLSPTSRRLLPLKKKRLQKSYGELHNSKLQSKSIKFVIHLQTVFKFGGSNIAVKKKNDCVRGYVENRN